MPGTHTLHFKYLYGAVLLCVHVFTTCSFKEGLWGLPMPFRELELMVQISIESLFLCFLTFFQICRELEQSFWPGNLKEI